MGRSRAAGSPRRTRRTTDPGRPRGPPGKGPPRRDRPSCRTPPAATRDAAAGPASSTRGRTVGAPTRPACPWTRGRGLRRSMRAPTRFIARGATTAVAGSNRCGMPNAPDPHWPHDVLTSAAAWIREPKSSGRCVRERHQGHAAHRVTGVHDRAVADHGVEHRHQVIGQLLDPHRPGRRRLRPPVTAVVVADDAYGVRPEDPRQFLDLVVPRPRRTRPPVHEQHRHRRVGRPTGLDVQPYAVRSRHAGPFHLDRHAISRSRSSAAR